MIIVLIQFFYKSTGFNSAVISNRQGEERACDESFSRLSDVKFAAEPNRLY